MRLFTGCFLMLAGFAAAIYCSVWLCFVGGIVQLVNGVQAVPVDAMNVALGILRILATGGVAYISAFFLLLPGMAMLRGKV